jgi:hypothetical protein
MINLQADRSSWRKPTNNLQGGYKVYAEKGLIGKKIGMTQIFDEKGNVFP